MKVKKDKRSVLQKELDEATLLLHTCVPFSTEYDEQLKVVERLHKMVKEDKDSEDHVSKDTIWAVAANLLGIGIIVGHEQFGTITSKAMGLIAKVRLH